MSRVVGRGMRGSALSRRRFVQMTGGVLASGVCHLEAGRPAGEAQLDAPPHYMVLVTLRGGFDATMSLDPKDQTEVGENIHCGYRPDERIRGSRRLFGPLIGGLEQHDPSLCLVHGVRSDTTSHPDGLAMLAQGGTRPRQGRIAGILSRSLAGDAPILNLDMVSPDGEPPFREAPRPVWAALRAEVHRRQAVALANGSSQGEWLREGAEETAHLEAFLDAATTDAADLDAGFRGALGKHFRFAFQAIRGNWARCVQVASRGLWFDSHSDNVRFQRQRQPETWADLATFVSLLKSTRNQFGSLFEQTTIAVCSEFGRFPRLNNERGKDHFPENSWLLCGKGVRQGVTVGLTDSYGKGTRVDFQTGLAGGDRARPVFIDNVFATLVAIAGGEPVESGYGDSPILSCAMA